MKLSCWRIVVSVIFDLAENREVLHGKTTGYGGTPATKQPILDQGLRAEVIKEFCNIYAHHHTHDPVNTSNLKVVTDADLIAACSLGRFLQRNS